jgi:crotonobetaine/carnitine-CoA ligase
MTDFVGEQRTVVHVLQHQSREHGDDVWITMNDRDFTVRDMNRRSSQLAASLRRIGVGQGDPVLVMLPNGIEFIDVWIALAKRQAIQVPVNTAYHGAMLQHVVKDSGARHIVIHSDFVEALLAATSDVPFQLETLVVVQEHPTDDLPGEARRRACRMLRFDRLLDADAVEVDASAELPRYCDVASIMYTSGTTGASKGVMVTHAHSYQYAAGDNALQLATGDIYYAPLPLFHIAGQWAVVYNCLIRGARAVMKARFSLGEFWSDVEKYGITATFMLGAMGSLLHRTSAGRRTTLAKVLMSPIIPEYREFCEKFGVRVATSYASTEVNGVLATDLNPPNHQTCGRVRADKFEVRLVDERDEEVPIGEIGELVVRPRLPWICMVGYWGRPAETVAAWRNGWLHSGDLLKRDDAGYYYFVDRLKDSIRRRGENISSVEVEIIINTIPGVIESAVVPVASEFTEQEVLACVVLAKDASLTEARLHEEMVSRLPKFMVPRYIRLLAEIPKTPTGKPQKFKLRSEVLAAQLWDAEQGPRKRTSQ